MPCIVIANSEKRGSTKEGLRKTFLNRRHKSRYTIIQNVGVSRRKVIVKSELLTKFRSLFLKYAFSNACWRCICGTLLGQYSGDWDDGAGNTSDWMWQLLNNLDYKSLIMYTIWTRSGGGGRRFKSFHSDQRSATFPTPPITFSMQLDSRFAVKIEPFFKFFNYSNLADGNLCPPRPAAHLFKLLHLL